MRLKGREIATADYLSGYETGAGWGGGQRGSMGSGEGYDEGDADGWGCLDGYGSNMFDPEGGPGLDDVDFESDYGLGRSTGEGRG